MKTVFLSFAGAGPHETSRALDWVRRLRAAGFEVIDHERHISYDLIMSDLARSDATVALVSWRGGTWAAIEQTSSVYGRDTMDGTRGSWAPKPTLLWFPDPVWDAAHPERPIHPYITRMLETGHAIRLPNDFEAAVARAGQIIEASDRDGTSAVDRWISAPPTTFRDAWAALRADIHAWGVDALHTPPLFFCQRRMSLAQDPNTPLVPIVIPRNLCLDEVAAEQHFIELVARGCHVIELRGHGLMGGYYLVALDHGLHVGHPYSELLITGRRDDRDHPGTRTAAFDASDLFVFGPAQPEVPACPSLTMAPLD